MKRTEEMKKLRVMKVSDLEKELVKRENEFSLAILKVKAGKLDKHSEASVLRTNVARIKTIINEKKLGEENG